MSSDSLTVALISDVFFGQRAEERLRARLGEAKAQGAELAVLPEIPLNPWSPATKLSDPNDAEPFGGPRERMASRAAQELGIGLVAGGIQVYPDGKRRNVSLVFTPDGKLVARYAKCHIPDEPGFWECYHYDQGTEPPRPIAELGFPFGCQICSDINRPEGCHLLGAAGALAVFGPRATELATYERWRVVFQANALTSCMYVLSVNRPGPEQGVLIGGGSIAVDPSGKILLETTDPVGVVTIHRSVVEQARVAYPGYLAVRSDLYAKAWAEIPPRGALPGRG